MKKIKEIPKFSSEKEEREFWENSDKYRTKINFKKIGIESFSFAIFGTKVSDSL